MADKPTTAAAAASIDQRDHDWRAQFLQIVRIEFTDNTISNTLNILPGEDDEPAAPCFFYGTLMALPILYNVIYRTVDPPEEQTRHLTVRPAILKDHRRRYVRFCDYPAVTVHPGSEVAGSVVTGLTKGNLRALHQFEGREYDFLPISVNVLMDRTPGPPGPDGKPTYENEVWIEMDAMTYIYIGGENRIDDREWVFQTFMDQHISHWSGLLQMSEAENQIHDARGYWKDGVV